MPTYTTNRPNTESTDPWADAAKNFLQSPSYANQYMAQALAAQEAAQGAATASPGGQPLSFGGDISGMSERDLLAGMLTAEGGSVEDMRYITDVLNNRVRSSAYPNDVRGAILQPGQFSAFNGVTGYAGGEGANDHWRRPTADAYSVADAFFDGSINGLTGGALNYYQPELAQPAWGGEGFRPLPGSTHVFGTAK